MTSIYGKGKKPLSEELNATLADYARQSWTMELLSSLRNGAYQLVEVPEEQQQPLAVPEDATMDTFVAAVLAVGKARREMLDKLRAALQHNDQRGAMAIARQLVNLAAEEGGADHVDGKPTLH